MWLILRFSLLKTYQPPSANLFSMPHINRVSRNSFKYNTPLFPDTPAFLPPLG